MYLFDVRAVNGLSVYLLMSVSGINLLVVIYHKVLFIHETGQLETRYSGLRFCFKSVGTLK